jgi:hypothetical protein
VRRNGWRHEDDIEETSVQPESESAAEVPSDRQLHELIVSALPSDLVLAPLEGFKMDLSANPGFRKIFFARRCDCGTAALLSIEVEQAKTSADVRKALPSLVTALEQKAKAFDGMTCESHQAMRLGPASNGP